jgi:hypothetical protein
VRTDSSALFNGSQEIADQYNAVFDTRVDSLKPYRDAYYFLAVDDSSAFNQLLANVALHRALFESKGKIVVDDTAIRYHIQAIKLANQRLGNAAEARSDGLIATILMMAAYNVIWTYPKRLLVHKLNIHE